MNKDIVSMYHSAGSVVMRTTTTKDLRAGTLRGSKAKFRHTHTQRERERQRDRETERQRQRETERDRDRDRVRASTGAEHISGQEFIC